MELKNELRLMLHLVILCTSMMIIPGPTFGTPDEKANATISENAPEFPDAPVIVTDSTLSSTLEKYSSLVLDCWENGCRPCQLIDPKINEMAADLKGRVVFGKLNTDRNINTVVKYRVFNYPTLLIFKNGSMVYRHIGNYPKATLEDMILKKLGINEKDR